MKKRISLVSCFIVLGSMGIAEAREASVMQVSETCAPATAETLRMEVESQMAIVAAGGRARFSITVTRGVDNRNDPRVPVEAAEVRLILTSEHGELFAAGVTDETGTALLSIRIPRSAPRGWLDAIGHASVRYGENHCLSPQEAGRWEERRVLRIISSS